MSDSVGPESRTGRPAQGDGLYREAEPDLVARSRELDLIQLLGRRAAEARAPSDLFAITFAVLSGVEPLDFIAVAHQLDDTPELLLYRGRPLSDSCVDALLKISAGLLGSETTKIQERWNELEGFDPLQTRRDELPREDVTVLPLLRKGQPAAYVLMVQSQPSTVHRLPLWYNAVNQLTVHLDRVLGVREDEADRFLSILESMPQAVLLIDGDLRVLQMNRAASQLRRDLGLPDDADGSAWFVHLGLEDGAEAVREGSLDILRDEVMGEKERTLNVTVTPLDGAGGAGRGLVLVLTDVSETRRLQRTLEQSERMSSLGQMISGVAHELNNPLSTILGYAQLLGARVEDEQTNRRLKTLADEAQRCRRIVENLLSFARRRDPERKAVSLNEVVTSVAALMRYQLRVESITLTTDLDSNLPALLGDRHELQQLLVNLVTNASHAIADTKVAGTIELRTQLQADGSTRLEVSDTGPGVPEDLRTKIFEPFFTSKEEGQGTGLGLALVSGIVRGHGGLIELVGREVGDAGAGSPPGATFRVTLPPANAVEDSPAPIPEEAVAPAEAKILIVDGNVSFARVICEALAEDGHMVHAAGSANRALEWFQMETFDLVISDMQMNGMDGLQLDHQLRRIRPDALWRLILTTGDTVSDEARHLEAEARFQILQKPFELGRLRSAVRDALTGRAEG